MNTEKVLYASEYTPNLSPRPWMNVDKAGIPEGTVVLSQVNRPAEFRAFPCHPQSLELNGSDKLLAEITMRISQVDVVVSYSV